MFPGSRKVSLSICLKAPQGDPSDQTPTRFAKRAILFKELRARGYLDSYRALNYIQCLRGESVIDAMVRLGLATNSWHAVDLIARDEADQDLILFAREIADLAPSS